MTIRITYDSKTIDIPIGPEGLGVNYKQDRRQQRSGSGKTETINLYGLQEMEYDARFVESIYRDLIAWWSWARQGKSWAFAKQSNKTKDTTLDGAAAAGQKTVPLTSLTFVSIGDICLMRAVDNDDEFEMIEIDVVGVGDITTVENLKFSYTSGDIFRHADYWPDVITTDTQFNPKKNGNYYTWVFKFVENL